MLAHSLYSEESQVWISHVSLYIRPCMRVDLSPRLGGHTCVPPNRGERSTASRVANQPPHYCPSLIHLHSPPRRNGVRPHSRCGTES